MDQEEFQSKIIVYQRIPRLTRAGFERGMRQIELIYTDIQVRPESREQWYESLISLPDEAFERACREWTSREIYFPNCWNLGELAEKHFPQRKLEIDAEGTMKERARREEIERRVAQGDTFEM